MKILTKNLGLIIPQRSAISASKEDLQGKFEVVEVVARRGSTIEVNDDTLTEARTEAEMGQLQIRLKSDKGRMFVMSLRQFIGLPLAPSGMLAEEVAKEMMDGDKVQNVPQGDLLKPLYTSILDSKNEEVELPDNITFAYIAERKSEDGTKSVYPAALYTKFQERIEVDTKAHAKKMKKDSSLGAFDIGTIYQDFNFMRSLENSELREGITSPEAQKILVIAKV